MRISSHLRGYDSDSHERHKNINGKNSNDTAKPQFTEGSERTPKPE